MKKIILLFVVLCAMQIHAQTYIIDKIVSNTNGFTGPMIGVPGDLFSSTITYSNTSNNVVLLFMNRYKNDIPKFWGDCYCYLNCHNVYQDTVTVFLAPHGSADVSIQFKTDSVNPGLAKVGFSVYQIGYANQVQDIQMTASTMMNVGLKDQNNPQLPVVFPNPSHNIVEVTTNTNIQSILLYNVIGELKQEYRHIEANTFNLNLTEFANGLYHLEINTGQKTFVQNIIKN